MAWLHPIDGGTAVTVWVVPGASRTRIEGEHGDALRVRVAAAPERGKANAAVGALLAGALGVANGAVVLASGERSRRKVFHVAGVGVADVQAALVGGRDR